MERFTFSGSSGEYCATCLRVLNEDHRLVKTALETSVPGETKSRWAAKTRRGGEKVHSLIRNSLERSVVVEAKVTSVDDVVCAGLLGQLIQRLQVSCETDAVSIHRPVKLTPEDPYLAHPQCIEFE